MTIKSIARHKCEPCSFRVNAGCPIMESCHTDVIRLDKKGFPYITYPDDCDSCFLCELNCPHKAVVVSAEVPLLFLERY
jgi:NAD-dependent dihydropyrimidine dehydrogenase PreA subunit